MTQIALLLADSDDLSVFVEIVGADLATQRVPLHQGAPVKVDLVPGEYLVREHWSDGRTDRGTRRAGLEPGEWVLKPPNNSAPELLKLGDPVNLPVRQVTPVLADGATVSLGRRNKGSWVERILTRGTDSILRADSVLPRLRARRRLPLPALKLWRRSTAGDSWESLEADAPARSTEGGFEIDLTVGDGLHVVEINMEGENEFVALPAEQSVVAMRWLEGGPRPVLRIDARTTEQDVEALRGYVARGEIEVARGLAAGVLAERLLAAKVAGPRSAALGGYVLLRLGDLERLHDWPDNLTRWKSWLPDGPVIAAWQRLRSPGPDYAEICELLLEAESRGLPVYTEGVRLLRDGLDLFASDYEDWGVHDAAQRVEAFARAMVWDKSETTYFGNAPDRPRASSIRRS